MTPLSNNVVKARSLVDCTGQCLVADTCLSALYETDRKLCRINYAKVFLNLSSMMTTSVLVPIKQVYLQEVFHVYLNKFENAVTHLFLAIFYNN